MSTETFGGRIRRARLAAGFNVAREFAAAIGSSWESLSRYEHDHSTPRLDVVARIAAQSGVSTDWLITGRGQGPAEPPSDESAPLETTGTEG